MNREQKRVYKRKYNSTQRAVNKALVNNSREIVREAAKKELWEIGGVKIIEEGSNSEGNE